MSLEVDSHVFGNPRMLVREVVVYDGVEFYNIRGEDYYINDDMQVWIPIPRSVKVTSPGHYLVSECTPGSPGYPSCPDCNGEIRNVESRWWRNSQKGSRECAKCGSCFVEIENEVS